MPSLLLSAAVTLLVKPFVGIVAVAMRHYRIAYIYAILSCLAWMGVLSLTLFLTVQLVTADANCAQVSLCYTCESHVQPVKCRVLSRFAMKDVRKQL
jgi:hypothetical protein